MADASSITKLHQNLSKDQKNTSKKFYTHFLFKALLFTIFCVILPLFQSQAPEFLNQTRIWELLNLIFVGIAVSYGLFSRRNEETGIENNNTSISSIATNHQSKLDNAHSYVSRLLQVSSVFDEETENEYGSSDEGKVQTWSNRYYRNDPEIVVAKDHSVLGKSSRISEKPLLLPVRSLKSRVLDADSPENIKDSAVNSGSLSRTASNLGSSNRFSRSSSEKSRNGETRGSNAFLDDKAKHEHIVPPSPIPWRSRSGRFEAKEIREDTSSPRNTRPVSMEEAEVNRIECRSFTPQTSRSPRPNSSSSSPRLSPSPSISSPRKLSSLPSESIGKSAEDSVRKKSFYGSCPPPPPPPPPPIFYKSMSIKPGSSSSSKKELTRSYTSDGSSRPRGQSDSSSLSSSSSSIIRMNQDRVFEDGFKELSRKSSGFEQGSPFEAEKLSQEGFLSSKASKEFSEEGNLEFVEKTVPETDDEDAYTEDDDEVDDTGASALASRILGSSDNEKEEQEEEDARTIRGSASGSDEGPDVDKKADEFIAKFREQIRLQRIESIKRSATAIRRNSSR